MNGVGCVWFQARIRYMILKYVLEIVQQCPETGYVHGSPEI